VLFCRIFSELSKSRISRHDKLLFQCLDTESKSKVFYIEPNVRHNKCQVFPLRTGLLLMPKPLRFVPQERIKYFEFTRKGQGLRYGEMNIILYPEDVDDEKEYVPTGDAEKDKKAERERKKRLRDNTITLEMIPNSEMSALECYFKSMGIECKIEGQESPQRKGSRKRTGDGVDNENEEGKDTDSAIMEMDSGEEGGGDMSSDDEEFDPNDHQPSGSDMDSDDEDDSEFDGDQEMMEEDDDDDDERISI